MRSKKPVSVSRKNTVNGAIESVPQGKPKPRLRPINRQQLILRAVDIEQLVEEDHEVRAIWELVGLLDLSRYYEDIKALEGVAGREPIDPRLLISIWIYSYTEGISSAREISRLCEYHPAYQWLTGMEMINNHTLSDFRVDHKEALDELFTEVLGLLSAEGLISLQRVMHDGTKVKACASADTFRRGGHLQAHLETARQHVAEMGDPRLAEEVGPRITAARKRRSVSSEGRRPKAKHVSVKAILRQEL
jgi:transposase